MTMKHAKDKSFTEAERAALKAFAALTDEQRKALEAQLIAKAESNKAVPK
jgi:hypothetical protein